MKHYPALTMVFSACNGAQQRMTHDQGGSADATV